MVTRGVKVENCIVEMPREGQRIKYLTSQHVLQETQFGCVLCSVWAGISSFLSAVVDLCVQSRRNFCNCSKMINHSPNLKKWLSLSSWILEVHLQHWSCIIFNEVQLHYNVSEPKGLFQAFLAERPLDNFSRKLTTCKTPLFKRFRWVLSTQTHDFSVVFP